MTGRQREGGPGSRGYSPGPSAPVRGVLGGNAAHIIKQRGAEPRECRAPFSFLKVPTARKEKIGNSEYKIAAWLGRETRVVIETYDDPNRAAKEAAEALVRSRKKAPPKQGLKCTGITPLRGRRTSAAGQFATRELVP